MGRQPEESVFDGIPTLRRGKLGGRAVVGVHGQLSNKCDPVLAQCADIVASWGDRLITFDPPGHGDRQDGKAFNPMAAGPGVRAFAQLARGQSTEVGLLASGIGPTSPCATRPLGRSSALGWRLRSSTSNTSPGRDGRVLGDG